VAQLVAIVVMRTFHLAQQTTPDWMFEIQGLLAHISLFSIRVSRLPLGQAW
jgi:hypothetical protein